MKDSTTFKYAEQLPNTLFEENRKKFLQLVKDFFPEIPADSLILMKGKMEVPIDSTDTNYEVIQESCFYYLFGVQEVGFYAVIEQETGKVTLFSPNSKVMSRIFEAPPRKAEIKKKYGLDTFYLSKLEKFIEEKKPKMILTPGGMNPFSEKMVDSPSFPWLTKYKVDSSQIYSIICNSRIVKSEGELDVMKEAMKASAEGHIEMMKHCKPGMRESMLQCIFDSYGLMNYNTKFKPYPDIVASGPNSATLHYETNNRIIKPDEFILCDCAYRFLGYCADITTTFPSNGKFTEKQKDIYNLVLSINQSVKDIIKPGSKWMDLESLCSKLLLEGLLKLGLVKGTIEELLATRVNMLFMPHALGHFLGLDPHDVGMEMLFMNMPLQKGMVVTVEPGCYFIEMMFDRGAKEFGVPLTNVVMEKVKEYMGIGGVRIEDDVIITETGTECVTTVPRTVEEVELCMAGKEWRKS